MKTIRNVTILTVVSVTLTACTGFIEWLEAQTDDQYVAVNINTGSGNSDGYMEPTNYQYVIKIGFKDASGNDLVAPLMAERWKPDDETSPWSGQINPEKYSLSIILSNPCEEYDNSIYANRVPVVDGVPLFVRDKKDLEHLLPYFRLTQYDKDFHWLPYYDQKTLKPVDLEGQYYLASFFWAGGGNDLQDNLTYSFSCPTIFGDNSIHQIVAYWEEEDIKDESSEIAQYPKCTKVLYDGEEIEFANRVYLPKDYYVKEGTTNPERAMMPREYYAAFVDIVLDK